MSKIHNLVYDTEQRDLDLQTSSRPTEANLLQERIEYLEWEIQSLKAELKATIKDYNEESRK
jgi:hypothetical protein